jgi:hypothetical protein
MSSKSKTTYAPPTAQQLAYQNQQLELGQKQLDYLSQQATAQQDYMTALKPQMDAQTQLYQQQLQQQQDYMTANKPAMDAQAQLYQQALEQYQQQNTPEAKAAAQEAQQKQLDAQNRANDLLTQQLQGQQALAPLQQQLLETQLKQALQGNAATPEQIAQIDAATQAAQASGTSDINEASQTALQQLRDTLAPSLGLRPTDTPIIDRGDLVAKEATRQAGQLASGLAQANANARLNYPLASQQISGAASQNTANIANAQQNFQAQLAQAAATNRLNLLNTGTQATGLGFQSGLGLIGAGQNAANTGLNAGLGLISGARGNPLSFNQDSTTTKNDPWGTAVGLVGGIGSALSGSSWLGGSDIRFKKDVRTLAHDRKGHRWVSFKYKGDPHNLTRIGVIAQEAEKIQPEAVYTNGLGLKYVDYGKLRA